MSLTGGIHCILEFAWVQFYKFYNLTLLEKMTIVFNLKDVWKIVFCRSAASAQKIADSKRYGYASLSSADASWDIGDMEGWGEGNIKRAGVGEREKKQARGGRSLFHIVPRTRSPLSFCSPLLPQGSAIGNAPRLWHTFTRTLTLRLVKMITIYQGWELAKNNFIFNFSFRTSMLLILFVNPNSPRTFLANTERSEPCDSYV